jgi:hypothetical protein
MMKPRKASNDTSRSLWPDDREVDRRRLRVSPLSLSFLPELTSAIELTAEDDGEFRFSGAPIAIVELSLLVGSEGTEMGGLSGETGFAGTGLPATTNLQRILIQVPGVYAATSEHARMVFTCAKFGGGLGQSNDGEASKVYAPQLFLGAF